MLNFYRIIKRRKPRWGRLWLSLILKLCLPNVDEAKRHGEGEESREVVPISDKVGQAADNQVAKQPLHAANQRAWK